MQTPLAEELDGEIDETIYIKNGTDTVDLSCGEVPPNALGIEWFLYKSNNFKIKMILKVHRNKFSRYPKYYKGYTADKYGISKSVNTSLVVKNIELSDTDNYTCSTTGGAVDHKYTTSLQVVGKSLLIYLVLG